MFTGGGPQPGSGRKPEILTKLSLPSTINKYRLKWKTADQRTRENREKKEAALSCTKPQNSNSTGCQTGTNKRQTKNKQKRLSLRRKENDLPKWQFSTLSLLTWWLVFQFVLKTPSLLTWWLVFCSDNTLHFWPDDLCFVLKNTFTSDLMTLCKLFW